MSINLDVKTIKTGFWHMPKTFYAVFLIEFWERFAFYGLQSVAVIYFVNKFGMHEAQADTLFGSFSALLYAMLTVGGFIGDRFLGLRRIYFLGIIFLILGYGMVCISPGVFGLYMGMGLILVGNILFKTNAANYVSRCFEANDPRLDSAFTYFYMSINIGSCSSLLIVPIISQIYGYKAGLSLMAIGMVIALLLYFVFIKRFRDLDNHVGKSKKNKLGIMLITVIGGVIFASLVSVLLKDLWLSKLVLYTVVVITFIIYLVIASKLNHYEARGMYIALLLMLQAVVFYILYIQIATSMTLFALHNVRLTILGLNVPAGATQSLNGGFIILLSPILANVYMKLQKKHGRDISIPGKFAGGLMVTGLCFIALGVGAQFFADKNAQVSVGWIFLAYFLYSLGELLVAAIGMSMVAQMLPKRYGGFAQGAWFISSAIGIQIGSQLSAYAAIEHNGSIIASETLHSYMKFFYELGLVSIVISIVLLTIIKRTYLAMESVKSHIA